MVVRAFTRTPLYPTSSFSLPYSEIEIFESRYIKKEVKLLRNMPHIWAFSIRLFVKLHKEVYILIADLSTE